MQSQSPRSLAALVALAVLLPSCSSGGQDDRPVSQVKVNSAHFFVGIVGAPRFAGFPVTTNDLTTVDGRLVLTDDGNYDLTDTNNTRLSASAYFLEADGGFSIQVPTPTQTLLYRGAYGLDGDTGDQFVTDRVGAGVGLYAGCARVAGPANLPAMVGDWHVMSMHAIMAQGTPAPDQDLVGRAFGGNLTLAADGSFTGAGVGSDAAAVNLRGNPNDFQAFADGRFLFEMTYDPTGRADYDRGFAAGGTSRILFGVDADGGGTDDAAGMIVMMRHRTASFAQSDLAGVYKLGLWTLFLRPDASGCDAAIGTLELTRDGNFLLKGVNNAGIDFDYRGTFTATDRGALTLQVASPTTETWVGAFDDGYHTVCFVDPTKETRANRQVELNFGVALRPKAALPQ